MTCSTMNKVLIIDDKSSSEKESSWNLVNGLNKQSKNVVDFESSSSGLWVLNKNQDEVERTNIDLKAYSFIFLHDSHNDSILKDGKVLISILPEHTNLVLFSGSRPESLSPLDCGNYNHNQADLGNKHYEIRRSIYYKNFPRFIESYLALGIFKIEALYYENYNYKRERANQLFNEIMVHLETSEDSAVASEAFQNFFILAGYEPIVTQKIKDNFLNFDYNEFREALEDEVTKIK